MARKNGVIDLIVASSPESNSEEPSTEPNGVTFLCSIREDRMRAGVERWVGLKLTKKCVLTEDMNTNSTVAF